MLYPTPLKNREKKDDIL